MLYLLAFQEGFEPQALRSLAEDPRLRERPEIVEAWVQELAAARSERERLGLEAESLLARNEALAAEIPWGVKASTRRLAGQIARRLRRT
jgi:hypothetical protein